MRRLRNLPLPLTALWLFTATASRAEPQVEPTLERLELSRRESVDLLVSHVAGTLRAFTNVGKLTTQGSEGGRFHFRFEPPEGGAPAWAVFAFVDEVPGRPPEVAVIRIALVGHADLEIETEPNAQVTVRVGSQSFGPQRADGHGHARVAVEVSPGMTSATIDAAAHGRTQVRTLPLPSPDSPWIAILSPARLQALEVGWLVVVGTAPFTGTEPSAEVNGAATERESTGSTHVARFRVTPPADAHRVRAWLRSAVSPEVRAEVAAPVEPLPRPRPIPPSEQGYRFALAGGGFAAGGSNGGPAVFVNAQHTLPGAAHGYLLGVELGFRPAELTAQLSDSSVANAHVYGLPVDVILQHALLVFPRWHLDGRVGAGVMPFMNQLDSTGSASFTQVGVGFDAFVALAAAYRLRPFEPFIELRGAYAPAVTRVSSAELGGLVAFLGLRVLP